MARLPDAVRERLEAPTFWHLATLNADGSPQVTPMWVDVEDEHVIFNTAIGRVKEENLRRDPRVSISNIDAENPYDRIEIRGRVVGFVEGGKGLVAIHSASAMFTRCWRPSSRMALARS